MAGPVPRALAWVIDFFVRVLLFFAIFASLSPFAKVGAGIAILLTFLLEWGYPVLFEWLWNGATPGKKIMGLRVLHDDGTPLGIHASVSRNLLRAVDFLPFLYAFGFIAMLFNRDFKRLGDLAAGTIVVHVQKSANTHRVPALPPLAPPIFLRLPEERALIEFAERRPLWSDARAAEIALQAGPLLEGLDNKQHGQAAVNRLIAYANHLVGRS